MRISSPHAAGLTPVKANTTVRSLIMTKRSRLRPQYAVAFCKRGITYAAMKQLDKAIADYDESIRFDPTNTETFCMRGSAYANKGQYDRAIVDCDEAIQLNSKNAIAFYVRGDAYEHKRDYDHAIADYDEAIKLNPQLTWAINNRAKIIARKDEVVGETSAEASMSSAGAYIGENQYDSAIADCDEGDQGFEKWHARRRAERSLYR